LLGTRIATAALLAAAAVFTVLYLPSWIMALIFGALWTIGAWEWAHFLSAPRGIAAGYAGVCIALLLLCGGAFDQSGAASLAALAMAWWLTALVSVLCFPWPAPAAFSAVAGLLVLVPSWFFLVYIHNSGSSGPALTMALLCIVWAADVGAFLCGRRFGRVKLAPAVSPGKTWEGVLGGLACASAVAVVAAVMLDRSVALWVALGLATAMVSVVGDLTVSMFKRRAGKKDSGRLLPGHGGILDRIDSLSAAAPIFFLGLELSGSGL
jgi:phosphatidate cytidylyltransferase